MTPQDTSPAHGKYQRIARFYDLLDLPFEARRYKRLRGHLFEGVRGRILDAGVGTGRNIPYYPPGATVTGIDLSTAMLSRAVERRERLGSSVELLEMDALNTSFSDRQFDTITSSFLFCVLDDSQQLPALREMHRICKPGGSIRILEYALSERPFKRLMMRLWSPWVRWAYGAAFDRQTERFLSRANLELVEKRFLFHDIIKLIVARPRV